MIEVCIAMSVTTAAIKLLGPDDAAILTRVADDVFDHPVDLDLAHEFLGDPGV